MSEIRIVEALKKLQEDFKELSKQPGPKGERGLTGPQGERGPQGLPGIDGKDGKDGKDGIGINGRDGKDGTDGYTPVKGIDYRDGMDGRDGADGIGIDKAEIKEDHLYLYFTDGRKVDCGNVRGRSGSSGTSIYITKAEIDENGHLIITLNTGKVIDAGYVGGGGSGSVVSVNGKTGEVVLDYEDVGASASDHNHDSDYSAIDHNHDEDYSAINHDHDNIYSSINHNHDNDYSDIGHNHNDLYASIEHTHSNVYTKSETYSKSEVNNLITFVVHLQDGEGGTLYADYTFAQILAAINRMQWVILKYQDQTYTVYERDNSHILWQSTRYYSSTLATKLFNLTSADVWSKESQTLSLNDIKPIVVHITKEGSVVTADYTFNQLIGAVSDQVIECCYNGNHVPMGTHTSQKITFTAQDVDMDTGATTEVVIEVDDTNTWRMLEDTYIPLKQDKLLYDYEGGLHVDGTLNSTYIDENGMLITTGSSGEWDAWNITGMNLNEFKIIRFVCYRDASNTGGTWVCDVPLLTPIQIHDNVGFFVSSGAMNSFGDRNRWNVAQCGVRWNNGNKDAISIGQVFSLYGTAATTVSGIKICAVYGVY